MDFGVHHEVQKLDDLIAQLSTIDDCIDHPVLEEELRALEVFWQFLSDCLFDDSWTSESDQGFRFTDDDVAQHRKTCSDTTSRWIGEH